VPIQDLILSNFDPYPQTNEGVKLNKTASPIQIVK
jgi:alpha-tubulin suppressor-like RCC1 family protein